MNFPIGTYLLIDSTFYGEVMLAKIIDSNRYTYVGTIYVHRYRPNLPIIANFSTLTPYLRLFFE